jgi:hypothetical protein
MDIAASSSADPVVAVSTAVRSSGVSRQSAAGSPLVLPFRGLNGNSIKARRFREVAVALADDLGGPDGLSEPTKILVRQAAGLTLEVEALQSRIVGGGAIDHEQLTRLSNSLSRMLHRLGLRKAAQSKLSLLAQMAEGAR